MARFLGDASGRTSAPYTDTQVNTACSNLCTYVNTVCSNINTAKLSCTGCGSGVTGIVTSITAGSGVSVNQSTGTVTISASGGNSPTILYNCACCWGGSATIPAETRGAYTHYEIIGHVGYWQYYCSQAAFCFAPSPGCSQSNYANYCCAHSACGWIGHAKCFNSSYTYSCAGAIAWPFGCGGGCLSACATCGFQWHAMLSPEHPCNANYRQFRYCFATSNGNYNCCTGIRNSGRAFPCCGMQSSCLRGVCITSVGSNGFACNSTITIIGHGRLSV
jgi:hypothetical protein